MTEVVAHDKKWWKEGLVYQIYPRSFKDSNGDGEGDIPGITSKLDYLKDLGVDILWVCPFFKSPQHDCGYDVSDYEDVHEPFGTVKDVEDLIKGCHDRGMKILFDLVINHTSDEHKWFQESRSSKDNPKRNWYFWHPGKTVDGVRQPPCNWKGCFGGSAWEWDEHTQEYYLHYYAKEQPDLNWESEDMRKALYQSSARFWLDKGCDGFRIDTANKYSKWIDWPDAPISEQVSQFHYRPHAQRASANELLDHYTVPTRRGSTPDLYSVMDQGFTSSYELPGDESAVTIGECGECYTTESVLKYVSKSADQLDMIIEFDLALIDHGGPRRRFYFLPNEWKLSEFKSITARAQELADPKLQAWAASYLNNHDQGRAVSRFGNDSPEHRVNSAKMLATYVLSLSGTSIIYQGEEIGMINAPRDWSIEQDFKDIWSINMWKEIKAVSEKENDPKLLEEGREGFHRFARDHARTPMQWSDEVSAGFSTSEKTWMRCMDSYKEINVASQEGVRESPLEYYRRLISLRKQHSDVFVYGDIKILDMNNEETMLYLKRATDGTKVAFFALNFTGAPQEFALPSEGEYDFKLEQQLTYGKGKTGLLEPYEAQVYLGTPKLRQ